MNIDTTTIKYLKEDEVERLYNAISEESLRYTLRNKAIFKTAKYCAFRVSEISNLKTNQINIDKKEIYCIRSKNGNNNTLRIIDEDVCKTLEDYLNYREMIEIDSEFLFPSQKRDAISRKMLDRLMKQYCYIANINTEKSHFHVLRHTRAIELAEKGFDIKDIQYWLGHKNIENTQIYCQFTSKQQETLYNKLVEQSARGLSDANKAEVITLIKQFIKED